jgi:exonuclease VII large subunit
LIDLQASLQNHKTRIVSATLKFLAEQKTALASLVSQLRYVSPERRIQSERQRVDELTRRAHSSLLHHIQLQATHIIGMQRRLEALNPNAVLGRGYAVVTRKNDGSVVSRVEQASDEMKVRVSDGEFEVRKVESKK